MAPASDKKPGLPTNKPSTVCPIKGENKVILRGNRAESMFWARLPQLQGTGRENLITPSEN